MAKLKTESVIDIRRRIGSGEPASLVAQAFGVGRRYALRIARGQAWRHVQVSEQVNR